MDFLCRQLFPETNFRDWKSKTILLSSMAANVCWNLAIASREICAAFESEMVGIVWEYWENNMVVSNFLLHDPKRLPAQLLGHERNGCQYKHRSGWNFYVDLPLYWNVPTRCGNKYQLFSRFELVFLKGALVPLLVSHCIVTRGGRDTGN